MMKRNTTKTGFSLMEIMFAVAILATGLVFVACQFPVGLVTCKEVLDETSHGINVHNAQTMLELDFAYNGFAYDTRPYNYINPMGLRIDPGRVHILVKPNVLADSYNTLGYWALIEDDLEFTYDSTVGGSPFIPLDLFDLNDFLGGLRFPFWTDFPLKTTSSFLGDIGNMVLPPVDETDPVVESAMRIYRINSGLLPTDVFYQQQLNLNIFDQALKRNYSWASMYLRNDPATQFIFTFRNPQKETRYAVQYPPSFCCLNVGNQDIDPLFNDRPPINNINTRPRPVLPDDTLFWNDTNYRFSDRLFPVPWRVALDDITTGGYDLNHQHPYNIDPITGMQTGETHFFYDHGSGARALDPTKTFEIPPPSRFTVDVNIGVLLRPGSIIIDADPPDILRKYEQSLVVPPAIPPPDRTLDGCGAIYEVQDIVADTSFDPVRYWVTLKTPLIDDMVYCWIFPPPIERGIDPATGAWNDAYEFEDQQPVINVTKKRLK